LPQGTQRGASKKIFPWPWKPVSRKVDPFKKKEINPFNVVTAVIWVTPRTLRRCFRLRDCCVCFARSKDYGVGINNLYMLTSSLEASHN